jgi:cell division protein FtsL
VSSRARARHRVRARAAIVWILVSAVLLAGVVFVNVAVLRLNLQIDQATQERSKLRAENAALESELSSALASPRIQSMARSRNGLVEADASTIGYIDLGR